MQPVPVLVTGASGFLGAHLVRTLLAAGCRVHAVSRRPQPTGPDNLRWWQADLAVAGYDGSELAETPGFDLTTYEQPMAEMVEAIVGMITGTLPAQSVSLPGRLIVRTSA